MSHKIRPFAIRDRDVSFVGMIRGEAFRVLLFHPDHDSRPPAHEIRLATVRVGRDAAGDFALVHEGVFALPGGASLELEAELESPDCAGLSLRVYRQGGIALASYFDADGRIHMSDTAEDA